MPRKPEMRINVYPHHSVNPFIDGVVESMTTTKTKKIAGFKWQDVLNHDTGELEKQHMMVLATRKEVDKREFVKVYKGQFKKFFGLSKSSHQLLDFIMENIRYSNDRIALSVSDIKEQTNISYATIYRSISQLLEKKLLAKAEFSGLYFINPQVFFKGDTITLINQFVKSEKKAEPVKKLNS